MGPRPSSRASRPSAGFRWWSCPRGPGTIWPSTSGSIGTTWSARSMPSGKHGYAPMDLGEVNGRIFVNNVSLGLYAAIVRSPEYRDAKVDTTLATLPRVLAPDTEPFDLRFTGPDGEPHQGAHMIQVSNNPYGPTLATMGSRPRLDTGLLGSSRSRSGATRRPRASWPRSRLGIRNGSKGCGPGRPRPSKCPQGRPSTSAWTARRSRWPRRSRSRSDRTRLPFGSRCARSAIHPPHARWAGDRRHGTSSGWHWANRSRADVRDREDRSPLRASLRRDRDRAR